MGDVYGDLLKQAESGKLAEKNIKEPKTGLQIIARKPITNKTYQRVEDLISSIEKKLGEDGLTTMQNEYISKFREAASALLGKKE